MSKPLNVEFLKSLWEKHNQRRNDLALHIATCTGERRPAPAAVIDEYNRITEAMYEMSASWSLNGN